MGKEPFVSYIAGDYDENLVEETKFRYKMLAEGKYIIPEQQWECKNCEFVCSKWNDFLAKIEQKNKQFTKNDVETWLSELSLNFSFDEVKSKFGFTYDKKNKIWRMA
jgi:hypothetical protein